MWVKAVQVAHIQIIKEISTGYVQLRNIVEGGNGGTISNHPNRTAIVEKMCGRNTGENNHNYGGKAMKADSTESINYLQQQEAIGGN